MNKNNNFEATVLQRLKELLKLETGIKDLRADFNNYTRNTGTLVEDSFENFLYRRMNKNQDVLKIEGIKNKEGNNIIFHSFDRNIEHKKNDEYDQEFEIDFLLINNKYLGIVEVKRNLSEHDIRAFKKRILKFKEITLIKDSKYNKLYANKEVLPILVSRTKVSNSIINYLKKKFDEYKNSFILTEDTQSQFSIVR